MFGIFYYVITDKETAKQSSFVLNRAAKSQKSFVLNYNLIWIYTYVSAYAPYLGTQKF